MIKKIVNICFLTLTLLIFSSSESLSANNCQGHELILYQGKCTGPEEYAQTYMYFRVQLLKKGCDVKNAEDAIDASGSTAIQDEDLRREKVAKNCRTQASSKKAKLAKAQDEIYFSTYALNKKIIEDIDSQHCRITRRELKLLNKYNPRIAIDGDFFYNKCANEL